MYVKITWEIATVLDDIHVLASEFDFSFVAVRLANRLADWAAGFARFNVLAYRFSSLALVDFQSSSL